MFGLSTRMLVFCIIVISLPILTIIKEQSKKLFSKFKTPNISIIRFEDIEISTDNINYSDPELFEIREIKENENKISFISKSYKRILLNSFIGIILLVPELIVMLWWKAPSNTSSSKLISISFYITGIFVLIGLIGSYLKYISCESLIINTNTGTCNRIKFGKSIDFPVNQIKNLLIVKEKIFQSKY